MSLSDKEAIDLDALREAERRLRFIAHPVTSRVDAYVAAVEARVRAEERDLLNAWREEAGDQEAFKRLAQDKVARLEVEIAALREEVRNIQSHALSCARVGEPMDFGYIQDRCRAALAHSPAPGA